MTIIDELKAEDAKINERMDKVQGNTRATTELMMERHKMYLRYEKKETDEFLKFRISTMREDAFTQVMLFKVKGDVEEDIAKIFSRLDDLETKIQSLNQRK